MGNKNSFYDKYKKIVNFFKKRKYTLIKKKKQWSVSLFSNLMAVDCLFVSNKYLKSQSFRNLHYNRVNSQILAFLDRLKTDLKLRLQTMNIHKELSAEDLATKLRNIFSSKEQFQQEQKALEKELFPDESTESDRKKEK